MTLYFDTSAINAFYDDPDRELLLSALPAFGTVRPSALNVSEIAATRDPVRRVELLRMLALMSAGTTAFQIPNLLLRRLLRAHSHGELTFSTEVDSNDDTIRVLRSPALATDGPREVAVNWTKTVQDFFDSIAVSLREKAQAARASNDSPYFASASASMRYLMLDPGEMYRKFITLMYLAETGKPAAVGDVATLARNRAMALFFASFVYAVQRRSMRITRYSRGRQAGGIDLQQAVYLAFADDFVTADHQQYRALRLLNVLNGRECRLWRYDAFRNRCCFK